MENQIGRLTENIKEKENIIRKTRDEEESKTDKIKKEMEGKMEEIREKYMDAYAKWETGNMANQILSRQLDEYVATNVRLEKNLSLALSNETINTPRAEVNTTDSKDKSETMGERVIILHDSLCRNINNTLLSREKVTTKKIWAMHEMIEKIEETERAETIVLQAFTRDVSKKSVEEMNEGINQVVDKALQKSEKVVISTIVAREDDEELKSKIDLINATMQHTYLDHENIFICNNINLHDKKFRWKDGIHLTEHGTAVLATNLKYRIAEALHITVEKKVKRDYGFPTYFGYN